MYNARFSSDKEHSRGRLHLGRGTVSRETVRKLAKFKKKCFLGSPVVASFIDIQKRVR